jgi:acetyl/propionyl-CoA carboxylase alpha subunit
MHVHLADEAICIGESEPSRSYLLAERVLSAARETNADAIHPGYGFLSERADFADACKAAGITFIGPSADSMRMLGDKISAKQVAVKQGVPITPGFFEPGSTNEQLLRAANDIGFPVMLKASAGGGGRGMRIVREPEEFMSEVSMARDEALKGFGDDAMMVEKLIERPRHIEVQLMADQHGNVAALFERDCSIQRRHQKLIEEAPSPAMTDSLWERMREAACNLALGCGYTGAGTVEFMVDDASGEFYFLEVNARLQVEHCVTEQITGLDLVRLQIEVARGKSLKDLISAPLLAGDRNAIQGHSIEIRVVAEDPTRDFMPSTGPIWGWAPPSGPGVRLDTGFGPGAEVTRFYDSLIAKLICTAPNRNAAIERTQRALEEFHILGVKTSIGYAHRLLATAEFQAGQFDTGFLSRHPELQEVEALTEAQIGLLGTLAANAAGANLKSHGESTEVPSAWDIADTFRLGR